MISDEEILLKVKVESLKMLKNRGYEIPEEERFFLRENEDIKLDTFLNYVQKLVPTKEGHLARDYILREKETSMKLRNRLSQFYYKKESGDICFVFFASSTGDSSMKKEEVKVYNRVLINSRSYAGISCNYGIIITEKKISSPTLKEMKETTAISYNSPQSGNITQVFLYDELLSNIEEHVYCPKHRILSEAEVKELIANSTMTESQISKISVNEAYVKRLGAVPGDIIMIERESVIEETLIDEEITFRRCYVPPEVKKAKTAKRK